MFCRYCGKELPDDAVFCSNCGQKMSGSNQSTPENEQKVTVFDFGMLTYNKGAVEKVNEWLRGQKIRIHSIDILCFMNTNLPLKWETVPNRIEIRYTETPTRGHYQLGYFKKMALWGVSYSDLDENLEAWKQAHPDCKVVFSAHRGHTTTNNGNTMSLYYLYYTEK